MAVGEGGQAAALIKGKQVDATSSFDTQFALAEIAGVSLRYLDAGGVELFPGGGILALEETLATRRAEAGAIAQSFAKGSVFAIANPEAAVRIVLTHGQGRGHHLGRRKKDPRGPRQSLATRPGWRATLGRKR